LQSPVTGFKAKWRTLSVNDLFDGDHRDLVFAPDSVLLGGYALPHEEILLQALDEVLAAAPWRYWETPGGSLMSAAKSNCGALGWVSSRLGYHYTEIDPDSGRPWPALPEAFRSVVNAAATIAGFPGFVPDGCLLNQYTPDAKLSLHQDSDEKDLESPVVTISLGLTATFLFGGMRRTDPTKKIRLAHGDVVVWGGKSRLAFHGIQPLKKGYHPRLGEQRISLTFRKVLL
jgi:alkylated DNA repair protein (DNA oxidative demethylase)